MELLDFLEQNIFKLDCASKSKEAVIKELIRIAGKKTGNILDEEKLFNAVAHKPNIENSGVGREIAILHSRGDTVKDIVVMLALCKNGIDFDATDKKFAKILFLVAAPEDRNREYLSILAKFSRIFRCAKLQQEVLEAENESEIIRIIKNWKQ